MLEIIHLIRACQKLVCSKIELTRYFCGSEIKKFQNRI